MGSEGLERPSFPKQKTAFSEQGAAISEARHDEAEENEAATTLDANQADTINDQQAAELRLIQLAWPKLPHESRKAILGIIAKANKRKRS